MWPHVSTASALVVLSQGQTSLILGLGLPRMLSPDLTRFISYHDLIHLQNMLQLSRLLLPVSLSLLLLDSL